MVIVWVEDILNNFEAWKNIKNGRDGLTLVGLFYVDWAGGVTRLTEAKWAVSSLYLSSTVLFPSSSSPSITVLVFCMIRTIGSFPAHHPCIYLTFSALEPVLYTYTMYASSIYSLKSCARASVTYRELCAVPGNKHHDSWIAKHLDFDYKWWSRCRINGDCMGFARQGDISRPRT